MKTRILTGDRPSGKLHLGHYIGSLKQRVDLQSKYDQYVMVADVQALTDNFENPTKVRHNITEVIKDYLSVGIDPQQTTIFVQSQIPEIAELTIYYLNLVTIARLERNPTVKAEIQQKNFGVSIPAGFFCYPVSQAADISIFRASLVPVGDDQLPMIEQTNEIVRKFNRIYGDSQELLVECKAMLSKCSRLLGIDGKAKASKSLGNAIMLDDSIEEINNKIMMMYTDPDHLKVSDPGKIEGNVVFQYLDAFHPDEEEVKSLKLAYQKGGLGDMTIKKILNKSLQELLLPIREKRAQISDEMVIDIIKSGSEKARNTAKETINIVRKAMQISW
jgi:tryptophanyl-tRNA synthetase